MTSWSFDHVAETRAALRAITQDPAYGATALSNVRIMSEVLPRMLRGARLERSILVTAAKENVARTMLEHVSDGLDPRLAVRLSAHFLATISPIPIGACYRVAAELALALELISAEEADALASTQDDAADLGADTGVNQADGESAPPTPPGTIGLTHPPPAGDKATAPWSGDFIRSPDEEQEHAWPSAASDDDTDEWASRGDEQQNGDDQQTGVGQFTPADTGGSGKTEPRTDQQLGGRPVPQ